jgi:hypothetical protein
MRDSLTPVQPKRAKAKATRWAGVDGGVPVVVVEKKVAGMVARIWSTCGLGIGDVLWKGHVVGDGEEEVVAGDQVC